MSAHRTLLGFAVSFAIVSAATAVNISDIYFSDFPKQVEDKLGKPGETVTSEAGWVYRYKNVNFMGVNNVDISFVWADIANEERKDIHLVLTAVAVFGNDAAYEIWKNRLTVLYGDGKSVGEGGSLSWEYEADYKFEVSLSQFERASGKTETGLLLYRVFK